MKNVEFGKAIDNKVEVAVDDNIYGVIKFDADQNVWVLWPEDINDAVCYMEDLDETEETIKFEIQHAED